MAVISSIIYLQLTPVMRKVLTMRTGGGGNKERREDGSRKTSGRLMLEIIDDFNIYIKSWLSFKGKQASQETERGRR